MGHTHDSSEVNSHEDDRGDDETESIVTKRVAIHEKLAKEMNDNGIDCEPLPYGSHQLEREDTYYSQLFSFSSRFVTNKGLIKVRGKNIDFIQILQRN